MTDTTPSAEGEARTILRWEVPVDDEWHVLPFVGSIIHVASRDASKVEIWTSQDTYVSKTTFGTGKQASETIQTINDEPNEREFRVFGTGQPVEGLHHGTALIGPFAWHLFSRFRPDVPHRE